MTKGSPDICCKGEVTPLDRELAETILQVGMFTELAAGVWERKLDDLAVMANFSGNVFNVWISPSVSTYQHHFDKRVAASVYFEIMASYAMKVGGSITQKANVTGCTEGGVTSRIIAHYPDHPLLWEGVCRGFQEVFMGAAQ